jgi:hypothetical protein
MAPPIRSLGELDSPGSRMTDNGAKQNSQDFAKNGSRQEMNVVAAYKAHFREDPLAFLQQVWAYGQGSGWRGYSDYIGAPILYHGQSEGVIRDVMNSEQVMNRITALATKRVDDLCAVLPPASGVDAAEVEEARRKLEAFKSKKREEITLQLIDVARDMTEVSVARLDSLTFLKVFAGTINNVLVRMYNHVSSRRAESVKVL